MKLALALAAIVFTGIGSAHLATTTPTTSRIVVAPTETLDPLERARRASFDILMREYHNSGSAVLISRIKLDNGGYQYRALTAYHVIQRMANAIIEDGFEANRTMFMTFQPEFHGQPLEMTLDIDDIGWTMPSHDWATFTFTSDHWLACAPVATEEEFKAISAFERIYSVGCGGEPGQQLREGIISVTHNLSTYNKSLKSKYPWRNKPNNFFRPSFSVWYGDSGGAIFNKDGKLIGLTIAFTNMQECWTSSMPVTHHNVALKAHIVRGFVEHSPDFFRVEK